VKSVIAVVIGLLFSTSIFADYMQVCWIGVQNNSTKILYYQNFIPNGAETLGSTPKPILSPGESDLIEIKVPDAQEGTGSAGTLIYTDANLAPVSIAFFNPIKIYFGGYALFNAQNALSATISKVLNTNTQINLYWRTYQYDIKSKQN